MKAKDRKSSFRYLNKLIDQYSNTCHHSIGTKPINDDCSALTEKVETNPKAHKFKAGINSGLLDITIFLVKVTLKIGEEKYLLSIL